MTTTADGVSSKLVQPAIYRGAVTPTSADIGDLWEDTSTSPPTLKQCTAAPNTFAAVSSSVAITGGTIDGATIGATTPSTGTFTTLTAQTEVLKGTGQNLILQSQALATSPWFNGGLTSIANNTTDVSDPLGGNTATKVVATGTNSAFGQPVTIATLPYTGSIYLRTLSGTVTAQLIVYLGVSPFTNIGTTNVTITSTWQRFTVITSTGTNASYNLQLNSISAGTIYSWGAQLEIGSTANTYIPTTTAAVYGTPTLSFSGVAGLGLQSDGSLYVSPAGTGALQAQKTDSSATGGNARGANAVDWQTSRSAATQVANGTYATIGGGQNNTSGAYGSVVGGGTTNFSRGNYNVICGGSNNQADGNFNNVFSAVVGGYSNLANGYLNFVGGGYGNSTNTTTAVTTQSGTMNGTTAVTLSGSNANIKVGQFITGTSINTFPPTYVAAISGTSLTLSQVASGSSTSTLSFYTPHGVVVGGGNNQATGSYSFIGGGGDAGTAANRNVASGDWSVVGGGRKNTASAIGSIVVGGGMGLDGITIGGNTVSGIASNIVGGFNNSITSGYSSIGGGAVNSLSGNCSAIMGGRAGTDRGIIGNHIFPACYTPVSTPQGVSQGGLLILGRQTTDATATVLCSDVSAASGINQVILPNNSAYYFRGEVVAGVTGAGNTKGWYIEGVIKRGANAASTALVGTPTVMSAYADAGAATWALTATADTTNGGLAITFTGQASTTIRVVAQIRTTEMTY